MAAISGFMYCEQTSATMHNGKLVPCILMPMPSIQVDNLPTEKSFSMCLCIADIDTECNHTVHILLRQDDNVSIDLGENKIEKEKLQKEFLLRIDIRNLKIDKEFTLCTIVLFDDVSIGEFPILIQKVGESDGE